MANDTSPVRYEVVHGVARIVLCRPPVNALSLEMIRAVVTAFERAADDRDARVVVLSSALAGYFSAGLDLDLLIGRTADEIEQFVSALYLGLYDAQCAVGKPSIAAVGGAARGGGMTMAVSCDVVIAAESATFGYPEIDVGLLPAIHFVHLPPLAGRHRAFELLFSGRAFGTPEAREIGIVSRIVSDDALEAETLRLAAQFAAKPEAVVRMGRAALVRQYGPNHRRRIAAAVEDFCRVAVTDAAQEGLLAFREKRRPAWARKPE